MAQSFVNSFKKQSGRSPIWVLPLVLIAAFLAIYSGLRDSGAETRGRLAPIPLPGGDSLQTPENGMNYALARYLASSDTDIPKRFVFNRISFDVASAQPLEGSRGTIRDLAKILKAYPAVRIRLEGHTDDTGDAGANRELSDQRAQSLKAILMESGVDGARIETAGYGAERPIASNETEDGRLRNRRIELVVIQKS